MTYRRLKLFSASFYSSIPTKMCCMHVNSSEVVFRSSIILNEASTLETDSDLVTKYCLPNFGEIHKKWNLSRFNNGFIIIIRDRTCSPFTFSARMKGETTERLWNIRIELIGNRDLDSFFLRTIEVNGTQPYKETTKTAFKHRTVWFV